MDEPRDTGHLEALAETLWQERHLTELLLYRLVCTRMLLAADEQRYTGIALTEVESVIGRLRDAERRRDDVVQALAVSWGVGIDDQLYLSALGEYAPQPWAGIFDDHRRAFLSLTAEIETVADDNRRLASSGLHRVQQTMEALTGGPATRLTYDPGGTAVVGVVTAVAAHAAGLVSNPVGSPMPAGATAAASARSKPPVGASGWIRASMARIRAMAPVTFSPGTHLRRLSSVTRAAT